MAGSLTSSIGASKSGKSGNSIWSILTIRLIVSGKRKKIVVTFYPFSRFFVFKKLQIYNLIFQSMNQKPSLSYPSQFAVLIGLMGAFLIVSALIIPFLGSFLMHIPANQVLKQIGRPENADASRILNTAASLFSFLMPAFILANLISKKPFNQLGFNTSLNARQFFLLVVITFASMILSGALGELNEIIPIPTKWFAKAKELENDYKASMMVMATMKTQADYLIALLVLAAAPAIFEEVLFQGRVSTGINWLDKQQMGWHHPHKYIIQCHSLFLFWIFTKGCVGYGVGIDFLPKQKYLVQHSAAFSKQCNGGNTVIHRFQTRENPLKKPWMKVCPSGGAWLLWLD